MINIVNEWEGRLVSVNLFIFVKFIRFKVYFKEEELDIVWWIEVNNCLGKINYYYFFFVIFIIYRLLEYYWVCVINFGWLFLIEVYGVLCLFI